MKLTPLQLGAWWPLPRRTEILLPRLDLILRASGFSVRQNAEQGRKRAEKGRTELFDSSRVALGNEKAWFALCPSRDGPWMTLQLKTRRRPVVAVFEDLFRVIVEPLRPQECVLCVSNAENSPIFAQEWCKGGLGGCVSCDSSPRIELRPGDPDWFRNVGVERRFVSQRLLARKSVDPVTFATQTGRVCSRMAAGFAFDGGRDAR
jgi:hypothetical protein